MGRFPDVLAFSKPLLRLCRKTTPVSHTAQGGSNLRRILGLAALAAAAFAMGLALPATARDRAPRELSSKEVKWAAKPSGGDVERYFPSGAKSQDVSGWSVLQCQIGPTTGPEISFKACRVLAEAPVGHDFGEAGLKLSRLFRLKPASSDADIVEGDVVTLPIVLNTSARAVPKINYVAGRASSLLTIAEKPSSRAFACMPSRPEVKCEAHDFIWDESPKLGETAALVRTAVGPASTTTLNCGLDAERRLADCKSGGAPSADQAKAMQDLARLFVAPAKADDKTPMSQGRIIIDFDWPVLRAALDAGFLTSAK